MSANIIAFSGTYGTGKSTCAYNLAAKVKMQGLNVVVLDEVARECPLPINQGASAATQYWILATQLRKEIKLTSKYDYVIADRSIMDTIAYGITLDVLDPDMAWAYKPYVLDLYKRIYLLDPIAFDYQVEDGIRDLDKEFRLKVDNTLYYLYKLLNISVIRISSQEELDAIEI